MAIDRRPVFRISFKENPDTFSGCPEEFYTQGFPFYRNVFNEAVDIGYKRFIFEYPAGSRLQNSDGSPSKRTSSQWTALKKLSDNVPVDATSYENEGTFPNGANSSAISGINPNNIDYQVSLTNFVLAQRERNDLLNDPLEICFRVGFDMSLFENNPFTMENSVPLNLLDNEPPSYSVDNPDNPDEPIIIQTVITPRQWVESNWKPLFDLTTPDANGNKKMFVDGVFESAESQAFFREISAWIDGQYGVKLVPLANDTTSDDLSLVNRRYYFEDGFINGDIIDNSSVEAYADVGLVDAYEAAQKTEIWAYCQQTFEIIQSASPIIPDFINYIIRGVYPSSDFSDRAGVFRPDGPVNRPQPSSNSELQGYDPDIILGDIPTEVSRPVSALQLTQDVVNKGFIPVVSDSSASVNELGGVVELGSAINLFKILNNNFQGSGQHPNDIEPGSIKPYDGHRRRRGFGIPEFEDQFCESCSECRDSINNRYFSLEFDPLSPISTINLDPRISDITNKYAFL